MFVSVVMDGITILSTSLRLDLEPNAGIKVDHVTCINNINSSYSVFKDCVMFL